MAAAAGSAILKRLAALNRSGVLAKPLQYSQVKADLSSINEEAALKILNQLEVDAAGVSEPVDYVKKAVLAAAAGPAGDRKRKAEEAGDTLVKRMRLMNGSGRLAQPIILNKVVEALKSLGAAQAMNILRSLENSAGSPNPNKFIRAAVRKAGGEVPDDPDADEYEAEEEEEEEDQDQGMALPLHVKQEAGNRGLPKPVKHEVVGRDFRGAKTEELTEVDKVERHIGWLNRNKALIQPIDPQEVLPALDCIGFRQAMRVMRRFEENCETIPDPAEYVKDLVARSGWIWAKPDIIDDDEKVAKRVSWLNQFGGLQQAIDYAKVADTLDGLKVAHAMVLLRELEVQSHQTPDPTEHILRQVGSAGQDELPAQAIASDSEVARRITALNKSGVLAANIELAEVGNDLARLPESDVAQLLFEVESKGTTVKNPTGFLKFKMKAKLASLPQENIGDDTKILKRIEWLNDYGGLLKDIDYGKVATALEIAGIEHAMSILKELEDNKRTARDPNAFIMNRVKSSWKTAKQGGGAQAGKATTQQAVGATADFKTLTSFMAFLNKNTKVRKKINLGEIATALDTLEPKKAAQVIRQMQVHGLGLDDPLSYIQAISARSALSSVKQEAEDGDDVAKITKRLKWLNSFAGLKQKININDVVGALYCLGIPQTMDILKTLQEHASRVKDPTKYVRLAVQRANGMAVNEEDELEDEFGGMDAYEQEMEEEEAPADGAIVDFEIPEGDEDEEDEGQYGADPMVDFEVEEEGEEAVAMDDAYGFEDVGAGEGGEEQVPEEAKEVAPRRIIGGLSGASGKLVPTRKNYQELGQPAPDMVKNELEEAAPQAEATPALPPLVKKGYAPLLTPQEKLLKVREYCIKRGFPDIQIQVLKMLARLKYSTARDLIDETALGGRNRTGVRNPNTYLQSGAERMKGGLGVEQGLAMELAVSLGVVLNNDALDELASVHRREGHNIIRLVSLNPEAKTDPLAFIQTEVLKSRAQYEAKPFPPAA